MNTIENLSKYVRSKNAGPFWITIDIFFDDLESYEKVAESPKINAKIFADMFKTEEARVKIFRLPQIKVIKISVPRIVPQGGPAEFDMHAGQQYIPVLDMEV